MYEVAEVESVCEYFLATTVASTEMVLVPTVIPLPAPIANPLASVAAPELVASLIAPPLESVCKPPVVDGANVKLVPVRSTPLEDVNVPAPENCEKVRKLSFSLLLSDPETYEGGNLQLMSEDNKSYIAPRQRGTIILFDSRTQHRVQKVTKGVRKSLVGWVVGNRWR